MWESHQGHFLDLAQQDWDEGSAEEKLERDYKFVKFGERVSITTKMECIFPRSRTSAETL